MNLGLVLQHSTESRHQVPSYVNIGMQGVHNCFGNFTSVDVLVL